VAIVSNGVLVKQTTQYFTPASWNGWPQAGITRAIRWGSYSAIYQRQLWVAVLVNKLANATARLPLKVYRRVDDGRDLLRDHPYAQLLRNPSTQLDPFLFWLWVSATKDIYGESFLLKRRDGAGRPVELMPWHPTRMEDEWVDGRRIWRLQHDNGERTPIARRDFVHFRTYSPESLHRGMSPLEPLRDTLENEAGARAANSALWRNGGRPSVALKHPGTFKKKETVDRLREQWAEIHGGVDNWAKVAVLEEGMEAQTLQLNSEELQYIEARKLNREECCAAYDVPPPVVHILDRATFSNITEQMRSMYRDTMAPKLGLIESTLEFELRDGRFGGNGEPDFGDDVYGEFLMDEVLRGDFETRTGAMAQAIQTGQMTPAEAREIENRPFIDGSDVLFINGAVVPIDAATQPPQPNIQPEALRSVMGRLSRPTSVAEIDPAELVAGLNGDARTVLRELERAQMGGLTVAQFRARLLTLEAS
jgi:HK97 family phage portal protein